MTAEQFCYWLQGRVELQPDTVPSDAEWKMIGAQLQTVFVKVTPNAQVQTIWQHTSHPSAAAANPYIPSYTTC